MRRSKRTSQRILGDRESQALASTLGGGIRSGRRAMRITQAELGRRVGVGPSRIGQMERGEGAGAPLGLWVALGLAVGRPLAVTLSRPTTEARIADAGHLEMQEFLLALARRTGRHGAFELPTRPAEPWRSVDVGVRDDRNRVLMIEEAWNTFGDVGAARRATARKAAEAESLAVAIGGDRPYRVATVWLVRPTAANRRLVARYPEVFASTCPGSSRAWIRALAEGATPPADAGLVWCDPAAAVSPSGDGAGRALRSAAR